MVHMAPNRNNDDLKTVMHNYGSQCLKCSVMTTYNVINLFTLRVKPPRFTVGCLKKKLQCTYNDYHIKFTKNHMVRMVIN